MTINTIVTDGIRKARSISNSGAVRPQPQGQQ
jgi:hypothetical protein